MITIDEAIRYLEDSQVDQKKGDELQQFHNEVLDMAIKALKEKKEK